MRSAATCIESITWEDPKASRPTLICSTETSEGACFSEKPVSADALSKVTGFTRGSWCVFSDPSNASAWVASFFASCGRSVASSPDFVSAGASAFTFAATLTKSAITSAGCSVTDSATRLAGSSVQLAAASRRLKRAAIDGEITSPEDAGVVTPDITIVRFFGGMSIPPYASSRSMPNVALNKPRISSSAFTSRRSIFSKTERPESAAYW